LGIAGRFSRKKIAQDLIDFQNAAYANQDQTDADDKIEIVLWNSESRRKMGSGRHKRDQTGAEICHQRNIGDDGQMAEDFKQAPEGLTNLLYLPISSILVTGPLRFKKALKP
jgi:hypothetical protein